MLIINPHPEAAKASGDTTRRGAARRIRPAERWLRRAPLMPALVVTIAITQLPFLLTLWYSFQSWNLLDPTGPHFGGLTNYVDVFTNPGFGSAILVTVAITVGTVVVAVILGLVLALLVHRDFLGRGVVRTLLITPFLVMPTAAGLLWKNSILDPVYGLANIVIKALGGHAVDWLARFPVTSIVAISVWTWAPFMMLILLGGLQGQSDDVIEAASLDGANSIQTFRFITLPHLRRYIELAMVLGSIFVLQTFDVIYMTTQGGPGQASVNLPFLLYLTAFRNFQIGQASALGVVVVALTIAVATFALRVFTRLSNTKEAV